MHPFLYEYLGGSFPLRIPMYGTMILIAFVSAFALVNNRARRVGIDPDKLYPLYGGAAIGGLIGARLLYVIAVEPAKILANPAALISTGGLAFYGGLIGGMAAVLAVAYYQKLPGWKLIDILAPALVLGMGIGRLGCFFAGCCHGAEAPMGDASELLGGGFLHGHIFWNTHFPFIYLEFEDGVGRLHNTALYPTQLWSVVSLVSLSAILLALWPVRRFDGMLAGLMFIIEPLLRIFIESYRADERGYVVEWAVQSVPAWLPPGFSRAGDVLPDGLHAQSAMIGITTSQFIGLGFLLCGIAVLAIRWRTTVAPEIPIADAEE